MVVCESDATGDAIDRHRRRDARCAMRETRDANANVWRAHGIDVGADDGTDARIRDVNVETKKNAFFCVKKTPFNATRDAAMSTTTTTWGPFARLKTMKRARAHHDDACAAFARDAYDEADAAFTRALEVDPRCHFALCSRALARLRMGDVRGALKDTHMCLREAPESPKAWYRRAQALEADGQMAEAMNALGEAERRDASAAHRPQLERAMSDLRKKIELMNDANVRESVARSEARRAIDVADEDADAERRRLVKREKWEASERARADGHRDTARKLNFDESDENVEIIDATEYDDCASVDSDASETMESYDAFGRALRIPRRVTNFSSVIRRLRTSVGAKHTTDMMCELRRYGNCQIEIPHNLDAIAKLKDVADAMDASGLPHVVLPAWRDVTEPWPETLADAHQNVQDVMWLLETISRVVVAAMYDDVGIEQSELEAALDSPLRHVDDSAVDISSSALVLSADDDVFSNYGCRHDALVRVDWLEDAKAVDVDADADIGALLEFTVGASLARRLGGAFMVTDDLHPRDRDGDDVDPVEHVRLNPERSRVVFFLCAKASRGEYE